jgi:hypothetical protein
MAIRGKYYSTLPPLPGSPLYSFMVGWPGAVRFLQIRIILLKLPLALLLLNLLLTVVRIAFALDARY